MGKNSVQSPGFSPYRAVFGARNPFGNHHLASTTPKRGTTCFLFRSKVIVRSRCGAAGSGDPA